jgi:hypothetical protein
VTNLAPRAFLDALLRLFLEEGWHDSDDAAAVLTVAVAASASGTFGDVDVAAITPPDFLERNRIDAARLGRALDRAFDDVRIRPDASDFELVQIDDIDSFSIVRNIDPARVAGFSAPLKVNERVIKHCVHQLIGDPYIDCDWGGERSDVASGRVELDGQRVVAAFLLKGPSVAGPLYGSKLGSRGDQIIRLLEQRAQLSVIQHVDAIPGETVDQLRYGVIALRATSAVPAARGSAWDGVDTARLLLAAGYIDEDGTMTATGKRANQEPGRRGP